MVVFNEICALLLKHCYSFSFLCCYNKLLTFCFPCLLHLTYFVLFHGSELEILTNLKTGARIQPSPVTMVQNRAILILYTFLGTCYNKKVDSPF